MNNVCGCVMKTYIIMPSKTPFGLLFSSGRNSSLPLMTLLAFACCFENLKLKSKIKLSIVSSQHTTMLEKPSLIHTYFDLTNSRVTK